MTWLHPRRPRSNWQGPLGIASFWPGKNRPAIRRATTAGGGADEVPRVGEVHRDVARWTGRLSTKVAPHAPRPRRLPKIVLAAMIVQVVGALALMPVSGQPFDLAALTGASEAWLRWGFPILYQWKFGFDLTLLMIGAQGLRFVLEHFGMSGAAALATAWKLPLLLADLLVGLTLLDLGRRLKVRHPALVPTLWLLSPVSLWVAAGHGQVEPLTVLAFTLSVDLLIRRRFMLAGVVVGLGVGIEFLPAGLVLVAGFWLVAGLMRRREALRFLAGLALALGACFGPTLVSTVGRASLLSGLSSTVAVTASSGAGNPVQPVVGSSLWAIFGIEPGRFWVISAVIAIALLFGFAAVRSRKKQHTVARQRLGVLATGGLLVCIVILDPGVLPQFSDLVLGGLCLIGVATEFSAAVIVLGPVCQLAGAFFKVYGGSFESYWYDMWFKSGHSGWTLPQSTLYANICDRLGALIIVAGLLWLIIRAVVPAGPSISSARSRSRWWWPKNTVVAVSAAVAILGSGFLAVWSLQPAFWSGVGSKGPQSLVDFSGVAGTRPVLVADTAHRAAVTVPPVLAEAMADSRVAPSMSLMIEARPLLLATDVGAPLPASVAVDDVALPTWSTRRKDVRSLWVSVLLSEARWVSLAEMQMTPPDLDDGSKIVRPTAVTWVTRGWGLLTYKLSSAAVSPTGHLRLTVKPTGAAKQRLLWNGSSRHRWIVADVRSGYASLTIDGISRRAAVTLPMPTIGTFAHESALVSGLPVEQGTTVTDASLGGLSGTVVTGALVWPTTKRLDGTVPGFALFTLGEVDLVLLLAGALALGLYLRRPVVEIPHRTPGLRPQPEREVSSRYPAWLRTGRQAASVLLAVCQSKLSQILALAASGRSQTGVDQGIRRGATGRVLVMTTRYPVDQPGGVERVVAAISERLAGGQPGWRLVNVSAYRGRVGLARIALVGDIAAAGRLALRTARGADVVMVHGAEYAWGPLLVSKLLRRPTVVVWHGVRGRRSLPPPKNTFEKLSQGIFRWSSDQLQRVALRAAATVAVSPTVAAEIRKRFGYAGRIEVIPNGVVEPVAAVRRRRRNRGHGLRVIWIGTTPYKKGLDIAMAACEQARATGQKLTLTVVGVSRASSDIHAEESPAWVTWAGRIAPEEVDRLMLTHDLMLSPTRYEPFGMAIFEALAAGLPVIGSAAAEWQIGGAGEVVFADDPAEYAAALIRLADPSRRRELGVAAIDRAREFTWGAAVAGYLRVLQAVAAIRDSDALIPVAAPVSDGVADK